MPVQPQVETQVERVLKQDVFGRVELVRRGAELCVRRVAVARGFAPTRWLARRLLARERRALAALEGLPGVARVLGGSRDDAELLRSFVPGTVLCRARELPRDFFEQLEALVRALHARGVCHNDLHKEANILVGADGYPALVDFQLASLHARRGRTFAVRAREDLRHVWKHRAHYLRGLGEADPLQGSLPRRSLLAEGWRRLGKPLYRRVKRAPGLRTALEAGEERRGRGDPWPRWSAPLGPRPSAAGSSPAAPPRAR